MNLNVRDIKAIQNYIDGEFVDAVSKKTIPNFEPATGLQYMTLPASGAEDVEKAVQSAQDAFPAWSRLTAAERAKHLRRLSELIEANLDQLATAETVDNGKPLHVSKGVDIPRSAYNFRFFADGITQFGSESYTTNHDTMNYVVHQPLGVVGIISPWNLPLYLLTWKIAPALAAGNCVIAKPSEVTPLTAYLFSWICKEAGFPPGVLNILHGLGQDVGDAISKHPSIKAVSFTGSTLTGRKISEAAAPLFKKVSLEMGGKNPTLVFADCDFDKTVSEVARAAFSNQGQICLCGSRILVEKSIYEKFRDALVAKTKTLKIADPLEKNGDLGALVSEAHYKKVLSYIDLAKQEGGKILCGGEPVKVSGRCEKGWFIAPTLIEGLPNSCRTNQEEIFGPVATLMPFESEAEALRLANDTIYGLACSVWTRDLNRAHRVARHMETGVVWINTWMNRDLRTPFGGMKSSGLGREGGMDAFKFYTESKTVCLQFEGSPL